MLGSVTAASSERKLLSLLSVIPDRLDLLPERSRNIRDWSTALHHADSQGVLSILVWGLRQVGWSMSSDLGWVQIRLQQLAMQQLMAASSLRRIVALLKENGVRCAPIKGPWLVDKYYPPGVIRPCVDIDVLIDEHSSSRAINALQSAGYSVEQPTRWTAYERWRHEIQAESRGSFPIELHLNVVDSFGVRLPSSMFLARASPLSTELLGSFLDLDFPDALLLVALHAASTMFTSAKWLMDVKLMLVTAKRSELAAALTRAEELHVRSAMLFALRYTKLTVAPNVDFPDPALLRFRHHLTRSLHTHVHRPIPNRRLSLMPLAHLLLTDSPRSWPRLVVFRICDHIARRR